MKSARPFPFNSVSDPQFASWASKKRDSLRFPPIRPQKAVFTPERSKIRFCFPQLSLSLVMDQPTAFYRPCLSPACICARKRYRGHKSRYMPPLALRFSPPASLIARPQIVKIALIAVWNPREKFKVNVQNFACLYRSFVLILF